MRVAINIHYPITMFQINLATILLLLSLNLFVPMVENASLIILVFHFSLKYIFSSLNNEEIC